MRTSEKVQDQSSESWINLKKLILDSKQNERMRLESLKQLGAIRAPDGSVPDEVFRSILEILWNFLSEGHGDFPGQAAELKSIFRAWKSVLAPKQLGFVLGVHRCIRKGSFVVFWACLGGDTGQRPERLIKEPRWRDFRSVIEEYEEGWHA
jgi:hypothetical protein